MTVQEQYLVFKFDFFLTQQPIKQIDIVAMSDPQDLEPGSGLESQTDAQVLERIIRAIREIDYGSVEIVIHNSRIVQIERKEKFRFDTESPPKRK